MTHLQEITQEAKDRLFPTKGSELEKISKSGYIQAPEIYGRLLNTCIGKTWNACVFEIKRPAGEERNRIRGAQRRGFFVLRHQGPFHLEGARIPRLTCLENGKPLA